MKTALFAFLILICLSSKAQITFTPQITTSLSDGLRISAGAELQMANLAFTGSWSPMQCKGIYTNGFSLGATLYLRNSETSPYVSMRINTQGKVIRSDYTGEAMRTMPILIGYRIYPFNNDLSFNIGTGIEIAQSTRIYPYIELTANYTLIKF
jgi:hypothetical protein